MPTRFLKESITTSDTIECLTDAEEAFFYRLLVVCDDYGRVDARPAVVRARCFPLRLSRMTEDRITQLICGIAKAGLIHLYAYHGRPYLAVVTWHDHQQTRAKASKCPDPDDPESIPIGVDEIATSLRVAPPGTPDTKPGRRTKRPTPESPTYPDWFVAWWQPWLDLGRTGSKVTCYKLAQEWVADVGIDRLVQATNHYLSVECAGREAAMVKLPETFLSRKQRFVDSILERLENGGSRGRRSQTPPATVSRSGAKGGSVPVRALSLDEWRALDGDPDDGANPRLDFGGAGARGGVRGGTSGGDDDRPAPDE